MFDAQLLIVGSSTATIYSPWFPRGGDNVTVSLEVVDVDGATIEVDLMTKNSEDTGNGDAVVASGILPISESSKGTSNATVGPDQLDELVRYRFKVSGSRGNWVLFRMLNPVWFDSVTL